jgi:hypothetical protein
MAGIGGTESGGWNPITKPVYVNQLKPIEELSNSMLEYVDDMYYKCLLNISHGKYLTGILSIKTLNILG